MAAMKFCAKVSEATSLLNIIPPSFLVSLKANGAKFINSIASPSAPITLQCL